MTIGLTLTTAGLAALVNATSTGTRASAIAAIGVSPTPIAPEPGMTELAGELKRITAIGGTVVSPTTIHLSMEDDSADAYSLYSFAIYLADGTLFALYGQSTPIFAKTDTAIGMLSIDIVLTDAGTSTGAITIEGSGFTNPPASTTVIGVTRFATQGEANAGADNTIALTPYAAARAVLGWMLGVDGAGSLLDSDLLDGQHGAYYANVIARLGYTPLDAASFTASNVLGLLLMVDGAGSLLDADKLDGLDSSAFLHASDVSSGSNANGYWEKRPDGNGGYIIEQWGRTGPFGGEGGNIITFPIEFPTACTYVECNVINNGSNISMDQGMQPCMPSTTQVEIYSQVYGGGSSTFPCYAFWKAKGH